MTDTNTQATDTTPDEVQTNPETTDTQPNTFDREYVQSLRQENAKWRTKARELEQAAEERTKEIERQKMSEFERMEADLKERDARLAEYEANLKRERALRTLTGKVVDPEAAFKLADGNETVYDEDGNINVDKLIEQFAFLAPNQPKGPTPVAPANTTASKQGALSPDEFRGKPADWVRENLHRLKRS